MFQRMWNTAGLRFFWAVFTLEALVLLGFRGAFWGRYFQKAEAISPQLMEKSWKIGLNYDLLLLCVLTLPLLLLIPFLNSLSPRRALLARLFLLAWLAAPLFGFLIDLEFYGAYHTRLSFLALEFFDEFWKNVGMLIAEYHLIPYLSLFALGLWAMGWALHRLHLWTLRTASPSFERRHAILWGLTWLVILQGAKDAWLIEPNRSAANKLSDSAFVNSFATNPLWNFIYDLNHFLRDRPQETAFLDAHLQELRPMLFEAKDIPLSSQIPLLRQAPVDPANPPKRWNVVIIFLETYAGRLMGKLGATMGLTPSLDQLAEEGIFFTRFFSNGSRTNRALFPTMYSFPNLQTSYPLSKTSQAGQLLGVGRLFASQGYESMYFYSGEFVKDDQLMSLKQQKFEKTFSVFDLKGNLSPHDLHKRLPDLNLYQKVHEELDRPRDRPFLAIVQTFTNHPPFIVPEHPSMFHEGRFREMSKTFVTYAYADWALGEFMKLAQNSSYFENTLFVLLGDHGFPLSDFTPLSLDTFHVPLVFYGPGVLGGKKGTRQIVASQVDLVPSILGLMNWTSPHASWGRNLFAPGLDEEGGFAPITEAGRGTDYGWVEKDILLVVTPSGPPLFFRYTVSPYTQVPISDWENNPKLLEIQEHLKLYLNSATEAFYSYRAGAIERPVHSSFSALPSPNLPD